MKNKKFLTIIAVVVMSGLLLTVGAMASNPAGGAYEQFKSLLDQEHEQIENATVNMSMAITDNGESVIVLNGTMKMNTVSEKMSGTFLATGKETKSFEIYQDSNDVLLHLTGSENWYKTTNKDEYSEDMSQIRRRDRGRDEDFGENKQLRDALIDTIMGDYKDQIAMTEANGLRRFSLSFNEGNMPVLLQAMFRLSDIQENEGCEDPENLSLLPQELQDAFADMKDFEYDVDFNEKKIKAIEISFAVNQQNHLEEMGMSLSCLGTDTEGTVHDLDIDFSMVLSDVETTVVDEANPDTAAIITIDSEIFESAPRGYRNHD